MDGIRKYSREWYALNGGTTDAQLNSVSGLESGHDKNRGNFSISRDVFTGSREEVEQKVNDLTKNLRGVPPSTYNAVNQYGMENIFNALDADGDGVITEEEYNDVAALSTKEFAENEDTSLSTEDLNILYENALEAVNSSFVNMGTKSEFRFENGDKTTINLNMNGTISSKSLQTTNDDGSKTTVTYQYSDKSTFTTETDNQGRLTRMAKDADGIENDYEQNIVYDADGGRTVTKEDFIATTTTKYDADNKLVSKDVNYNYDSDGVIDDTKQQSIGDCWVLSGVNALRESAVGAAILKNAIHQNDDGSVTVTLKGVNREYTYSAEEIIKHQYQSSNLKYSTGDTDMNLFEMAIGDYRKELIESGDYTKNSRDLSRTAGDEATVDDPLKGGQLDEAIYYISGFTSEFEGMHVDKETGEYDEARHQEVMASAREMLDTYGNSVNKYIMNVSFIEKDPSITDGTITTFHVYSVSHVDDENVYVVNPWDSSVQIAYPKEEFINNVKQMSLTDLMPGQNEQFITAPKDDVVYTPINGQQTGGFGNKVRNFFKNLFS